MPLTNYHNVYLIGIGGIGMSALARWFNANGFKVGGYDRTSSDLTCALESEGIEVHYEDLGDNVPVKFTAKDTLVVYTPAVPKDHGELKFFQSKGFDVKKRSEVLGLLTKSFFTIAVAGTHGKTTTSSMIAHILKEAGKNVFAFIGGITQNYNTNLLLGDNSAGEEIMVVEADEYDRSFLRLYPNVAVITSTDADHLDIYGSQDSITETFSLFADQIVEKGALIIKEGLPVKASVKEVSCESFGINEGDLKAENIRVHDGAFIFDITGREVVKGVKLYVPGRHNILNALAAYIAARKVGIEPEVVKCALESFKGVKRRFELIVANNKIKYIDDYAHHPTEIEATLSAARALFSGKKITVVFQPHLYTRTRDFLSEFGNSLTLADKVILLPIYPARESPIDGISSEALLNEIYITDKEVCSKERLLERIKEIRTDVLITLGAGDIDRFVEPIKDLFEHEEVA